MRGTILSAVVIAGALAGCYTTADVGYSTAAPAPAAEAYSNGPDLVAVSPGVQVVADYDEPVFFSDGFYWRFNDGYWYRSNNYATGWYYYERPPVAIVRIDRPYAYAHYRPAGYVARSRPVYRPEVITRDRRAVVRPEPVVRERTQVRTEPTYRNETVVRDHREVAPAPRAAPAPAPVVRDHRAAPPAKKEVVRDHRDK
jgi:hypothetical protein